ncbi:TPA: TlpA family protein disulfide reductase, partial [Candidatus Poribacteria bacterium]|nr:TlpA family protein disulfide reductase [Candidatus Poribacteria bacterium]
MLSTDFKPVSLSDYRGKIVLLDFWATWCKPCQEEIPIFIDLYDQYRNQGFEMVGISIDSERLKVVNPFIEKLGVNYTILLGEPNLMDKYNIMAIPTAVLIDQSGNIRKR